LQAIRTFTDLAYLNRPQAGSCNRVAIAKAVGRILVAEAG
jgi:hypothetical protein